MTVAVRTPRIVGVQTPQYAPPQPAKTKLAVLKKEAAEAGIKLIPAQETAGKYLMATGPDGWLYPEVAIIEARRNGKTEILVPRIRADLRAGRAILHTAQNRTLPRRVFMRVARSLPRSEVESIRFANGQESIVMRNGGEYLIVAPQRGARGLGADTLIFDEIREFEDEDVMAAAKPTIASSPNGQIIYLSNAGSHRSVILNDLKRRGEQGDPGLAYLEWSAGAERATDDRDGWLEANPAVGYFLKMDSLETAYRTLSHARFETEHLCRWVDSMLPSVVSEAAFMECVTTIDDKPSRPVIGINMHPTGSRASAMMAWQRTDGRIALVELLEATGSPDRHRGTRAGHPSPQGAARRQACRVRELDRQGHRAPYPRRRGPRRQGVRRGLGVLRPHGHARPPRRGRWRPRSHRRREVERAQAARLRVVDRHAGRPRTTDHGIPRRRPRGMDGVSTP